MGSVYEAVKLTSGLGDCLIVASILQNICRQKNVSYKYCTNPALKFLFDFHPDINYIEEKEFYSIPHKNRKELKWVSQLPYNLYGCHTINRFALQLNTTCDPSEVFNIHLKGSMLECRSPKKIVCINQYAAEKNRRFIPSKYISLIADYCSNLGYEVKFVGSCDQDSYSQIDFTLLDLLASCKLFIGPVSFMYHLASCIKTKCLLFTSYMPSYKFSHFFNTVSIESNRSCSYLCEQYEKTYRIDNNCLDSCKAVDYCTDEIIFKLNKLL